jgi:hypothetical protein
LRRQLGAPHSRLLPAAAASWQLEAAQLEAVGPLQGPPERVVPLVCAESRVDVAGPDLPPLRQAVQPVAWRHPVRLRDDHGGCQRPPVKALVAVARDLSA